MPRYRAGSETEEIVYTLSEISAPNGYTTTQSEDGFTITNTLKRITLIGTVYWHGDTIDQRPDNVIIDLYQDGSGIAFPYPAEYIVWTKNETEGYWTYTITGIPAYKSDGTLHTWQALQEVVYPYVLSPDTKNSGVVDAEGNVTGMDFHNYYNIRTYTIEKVWVNTNKPKDSIGVVLQRRRSDENEAAWKDYEKVTMNNPDWTYVWNGLPVYDFSDPNNPVTYGYRVFEPTPGFEFDASYDYGVEKTVITNSGTDIGAFFSVYTFPETGFSSRHFTSLHEKPKNLNMQPIGMELMIPQFDVTAKIVTAPLTDHGWEVEWLDKDAGLLEGSAPPGKGISVIAGHNHINTTEIGPFLFLMNLKENDRLFVRDQNGNLQHYRVYGNLKLLPDDVISLSKMTKDRKNPLVLITCEDEKEGGGYMYRRVIFAEKME